MDACVCMCLLFVCVYACICVYICAFIHVCVCMYYVCVVGWNILNVT